MGTPIDKGEWGEFRTWFDETIVPFLEKRGYDYCEYGADTDELAEMFQQIFEDRKVDSDYQKMFEWRGAKHLLMLPEGYEIRKVGRDFLKTEYSNKEFFMEELENAYGKWEAFFESGIAYAAVHENRVIARADMLFTDGIYGNISVNTEEEHRKKGISAYLTQQTIQDTLKAGIKPIWDCTEDNIASEKTAEKCGFQLVRRDIISWFKI